MNQDAAFAVHLSGYQMFVLSCCCNVLACGTVVLASLLLTALFIDLLDGDHPTKIAPQKIGKSVSLTYGLNWVALQSKTGRVSCVCDWLRDATGLDFGDRSWICNTALEN